MESANPPAMRTAYFVDGVSSIFEMSTADAHRILPEHLQPIEVRPQRSLLSVSAFHFHDSQVGPYAELILAVVVPPVVGGWSRYPKAGFFPFMAATSSPESRALLRDDLRMPTHPDPIEVQFLERDDRGRLQVWCMGEPVVDLTIRVHKWLDRTHLLHTFMVDGDQRLKSDLTISGSYSMHEQESGRIILHPHAITAGLTLEDVSQEALREHWLKEGEEVFSLPETV